MPKFKNRKEMLDWINANLHEYEKKQPKQEKSQVDHPGLFHRGQDPWNKDKPSPFKGLTYEQIGRNQSPLTGIPRSEEDRRKMSKGQFKRWGNLDCIPVEPRDDINNEKWKKTVKKRDKYTCQGCGIHQKDLPKTGNPVKDYLHAHHIKAWAEFPELRFEPTNGITYCMPCHWKAENKQITVPDSMPPIQKKSRKRANLGICYQCFNPLKKNNTDEKVFCSKKCSDLHSRGRVAWNAGKTNIEIYGKEDAARLSNIAAENARRTRNHLGHHHSEASKEKNRQSHLNNKRLTEVEVNER